MIGLIQWEVWRHIKNNMKFPCTKCGACCMKAGELGFMPAKEDGSCIHLNKDNMCDIYDERPDICSIEKTYYMHRMQGIIHNDMTKEDYYKASALICNIFMDEKDIDDSFRIGEA